MSGTQGNVTAAGDYGGCGILFNSRRRGRGDFEVIAFDSSYNNGEILGGNVRVPDRERGHQGQQRNGKNLRPGSEMLLRDRQRKHVYPQLPEGVDQAILTPPSTYTITACRNK
jgi:hypothetical protein